jgi:hypothetical protein
MVAWLLIKPVMGTKNRRQKRKNKCIRREEGGGKTREDRKKCNFK